MLRELLPLYKLCPRRLLPALETWFQDTPPTCQSETYLYATTVKGHGRQGQYTLALLRR